jgi:NAD(P)-dependent dehydrogenase (short-subunit alcohol dehydrogenase family)
MEDSMTRENDIARTKDGRPLRGQRVVVVGGTSGMGLGAVRAAVSAGAEVIAAGRRTAAERAVVESGDHPVRQLVLDITDETAIREVFEEIGSLITCSSRPRQKRPPNRSSIRMWRPHGNS